ncbi:MAG: lysine-sensitive aspartokinase 3 [Gemmatimonadota bacterium]
MIVLKFGGTSVGDASAIQRLVDVVELATADAPLVVVSAMTRVTNSLLDLDALLTSDEYAEAERLRRELQHRHEQTAAALKVAGWVVGDLLASFEELAELIRVFPPVADLARRDRIAGFGELWSSLLVTGASEAKGLAASWFDARTVMHTDSHFGAAIPDEPAIRTAVARDLAPRIGAGQVVVTQGFIGRNAAGAPTTLGRGGSDFSAALFGAALGASRVEIWTDVDGLMSADPRVVPDARLLSHATYDEAAELAAFGAKVLHPATQLPLVEAGIPIVIRNTFAPEKPGTWIGAESLDDGSLPVRSISFKPGVTIVQIRAARMLGAYGFLRRIFEVFERHEIVVDVLASSEVSVSLTIDDGTQLAAVVHDLGAIGEVTVKPGRGVVAVVGRAIRETPGIAARVYSAIADVNVEMISQGASASNLTFIVAEANGPQVVRALHQAFFPEFE